MQISDRFDKICFIGDLHSSQFLNDFIIKYDDNATFFVFLGDLFDRGKEPVKVFETIKTLYDDKKALIILWNHDLFYILWFANTIYKKRWLNIRKLYLDKWGSPEFMYFEPLWNTYYWLAVANGVDKTDEAFKKAWYDGWQLDWLFENWVLCERIDWFGLVHWWIPVVWYNSPVLVWDFFWSEYLQWVAYVKALSAWLKKLDYHSIEILSATDNLSYPHLRRMQLAGIDIPAENVEYSRMFVPTWFDNSRYDIPDVKNVLVKELNDNDIHSIVVWHWWNRSYEFDLTLKSPIFKIDRSFLSKDWVFWNFWYFIWHRKMEYVLEWWDSKRSLWLI